MFTARVLRDLGVDDEQLHKLLQPNRGKESRVRWIERFLDKFPSVDVTGSLQQSDLLRGFYLTIAKHGLHAAYEQANDSKEVSDVHVGEHVIIVGAGMSGLVAAYELAKEKYNVEILEMSQRFGGRVYTFGQKEGYDRGLHTDAGAMRIPQPPPKFGQTRPTDDMIHYLTDYYALTELKLNAVPFSNSSSEAFYLFYGHRTKISEWPNTREQFSKYWPHWDDKIKHTHPEIQTINDYYEATTGIVINLLKKRLAGIPPKNVSGRAKQWNQWTNNWCQFSVGSFLRSTLEGIESQVVFQDGSHVCKDDIKELKDYLPWPEAAITAYQVFNYTPGIDISLVTEIQDAMGKWWSSNMHSLDGGLSALPNALAAEEIVIDGKKTGKHVEEFITYNRMVTKVVYNWDGNQKKSVEVHGVITSSGEPFVVKGRSVILTVPLNVLRGIQIVNKKCKPLFPKDFQKAIQNINYSPSTKIMLQYEKQFWNTDGSNIAGGFSKTNLPIGQLHYPTSVQQKGDQFLPVPAKPDSSGILMVYTWKAEALLWGALTEDQAIMLAVNQIDEIHPDIPTKKYFQMGKRQAWASDPTTLGAFALLEPRQYISVMYLMQHSWRNIYFSGEAISFANGWIQGALESGLRAAYQLYAGDQLFTTVDEPSF